MLKATRLVLFTYTTQSSAGASLGMQRGGGGRRGLFVLSLSQTARAASTSFDVARNQTSSLVFLSFLCTLFSAPPFTPPHNQSSGSPPQRQPTPLIHI